MCGILGMIHAQAEGNSVAAELQCASVTYQANGMLIHMMQRGPISATTPWSRCLRHFHLRRRRSDISMQRQWARSQGLPGRSQDPRLTWLYGCFWARLLRANKSLLCPQVWATSAILPLARAPILKPSLFLSIRLTEYPWLTYVSDQARGQFATQAKHSSEWQSDQRY